MISKISKKDIKHTAHIIAECFEDYPTYKFYFPDDTKRKKQIYYINWYRVYIMQKYTYAINTTDAFISDKSFYAETHTEKNWRLYRMLGAELIEKSEWNGITHYFFKFLPENDVRTRRRNRRSSQNSNH